MSKTTESIISIVQTGVDLEISAIGKTTESLIRIVQSARPGQVITIRDCDKLITESVIRIAQSGKVKISL